VRLSATEFLRRWVAHVLPRGFVKIPHDGLLANRGRTERLQLCRALLALWTVVQTVLDAADGANPGESPTRPSCPACGSEQWAVVAELRPQREGRAADAEAARVVPDTS